MFSNFTYNIKVAFRKAFEDLFIPNNVYLVSYAISDAGILSIRDSTITLAKGISGDKMVSKIRGFVHSTHNVN